MARRGHAVRPRFIHFTGRLLCPGTQNATNGAISLQTDFEMPFPGASAPGTQNERDRDMTRFRSILAVLGLGLTAATVPPATSLALGPGFFDQVIAPAGLTCSFNAYHDSAAQETQLNLFIPNGASQSSGGNYWSGGVITSWPGGDITAAAIASECGGRTGRAMLITIDSAHAFDSIKFGLLRRIAEDTEDHLSDYWTMDNIMISATHTHSSAAGISHYDLLNVFALGFDEQALGELERAHLAESGR